MKIFECNMCGACCSNLGRDQVVLLLGTDIAAMGRGLNLTATKVLAGYCEVNHELSGRAGRAIVQLKSNQGRCVFLDAANRCAIHAFKPFQCRYGPDRFLPKAMGTDYECMKDVELPADQDVTESFFNALMEDKMPSGPAINMGVQIDAARKRQLTDSFSGPDEGRALPDPALAGDQSVKAETAAKAGTTDHDEPRPDQP